MGCFAACFGTWKHKKRLQACGEAPLKNQSLSPCHEIQEAVKLLTAKSLKEGESVNPISESVGINEEELNSSASEKVTFNDWNKDGLTNILESNLVKNENEKVGREKEKCEEDGSDSTVSSLISYTPNHKVLTNIVESNLVKNGNEKVKKKRETGKDYDSDSTASSLMSYPPNHSGMLNKFESCSLYCPVVSTNEQKACHSLKSACCDGKSSQKDLEECNSLDHFKGNVDGGIGDCGFIQEEEFSESLFSLSIDSRKHFSAAEMGEKEVISPLKPANSVLNSVENLSQKKFVKVKTASTTLLNREEEKENINLEPDLKQSIQQPKLESDNEIAVETSLSSWLVESEKSFKNENSPSSVGNSSERSKSLKSFGNRPVLEELTCKEFDESLSSQQTWSHGSDDVPGIGTIGRYWQHTWRVTDVD
ncbi:unnamed protein product [Fraxinus pennsylvanica]|uniref:Uncharacterized protein n=1 Tax=Fraxinus pennsylvanica TaxID=56036 RepID=A0AAD2DMB3_9LAMI|nr:unnamed protein product [Fraxinus pennsylvanica]